MKNTKKKCINLSLSFIVAIAFCYLCSVEINNIIFFVPSFLVTFFFFYNFDYEYDKYALLLSIVVSFFVCLGKYVVFIYEVSGIDLLIRTSIIFVGSLVFFARMFPHLFKWIQKISLKETKIKETFLFFISFSILNLCWLPFWLSKCPGSINPDTMTQVKQALGVFAYNNSNPLLYTLTIKLLFAIASVFTKDINTQMLIATLLTMVINSLIYSYVILHIYRRTRSLLLCTLSIAFFGLVSYNVYYNTTISKDGAYAAFLALFIVMVDKYYLSSTKLNAALVIVSGVVYSLFRSNGYYSLILFIAFLALLFIKGKERKLFIVICITLILSTIIKVPVYSSIIEANKATINSSKNNTESKPHKTYVFKGTFLHIIPFQQVANVVAKGRELNEKEEWLIEEYIDLEAVRDVYNPILVDPLFSYIENKVKPTRCNISDIEYVKLWIELFFKYPQDYVEAYVNMNRYYFYPNRYVKMYVTGIVDNNIGISDMNIVSSEIKEAIDNFYDSQKDIPVVGAIYCPGVITFIMFVAIFFQLKKKNTSNLALLIPICANFAILMFFVPLNDEFRYYYPISACLPLIVSLFFFKDKEVRGIEK